MTASESTTPESTPRRPVSFLPISVATLECDSPLHVDLYITTQVNKPPVLYRSASLPADRAEVQRLMAQGVHTVYIQSHDYATFQDHLRDNLPGFLNDTSRPLSVRMAFLAERSRDVLKAAFETRDTNKLLQDSRGVANDLVKLASSHGLVPADQYAMLRHDYCTFAHSFRTALYTMILGKAAGISERQTLHDLALGALLHDIGKLRLPAKVLSKTTALNEVEQKLLSQHPQFGFERLCHREDLRVEQLMVVYQHHEHINGTGYPVGLSGDEIHPWARLTAVANAFDVRTMTRPGQAAVSVTDAVATMKDQAGSKLDREMVSCWTQCMTA
jgi:HD-GYP domain-containing protein (c-di-GMP phosphodiesterase class II)